MHPRMRSRSRRERTAASDDELSTLPGKRRVLSVVLSGDIVPREAQCMNMTLRGMRERDAISGRMTRVVEVQRLGGGRIDALGAFSGHIHQFRRLHRPLGPVAMEANRRRFHT